MSSKHKLSPAEQGKYMPTGIHAEVTGESEIHMIHTDETYRAKRIHLYFKCRLCKQKTGGWSSKNENITAEGAIMEHNTPSYLSMHKCNDGRLGVQDLIGGKAYTMEEDRVADEADAERY